MSWRACQKDNRIKSGAIMGPIYSSSVFLHHPRVSSNQLYKSCPWSTKHCAIEEMVSETDFTQVPRYVFHRHWHCHYHQIEVSCSFSSHAMHRIWKISTSDVSATTRVRLVHASFENKFVCFHIFGFKIILGISAVPLAYSGTHWMWVAC